MTRLVLIALLVAGCGGKKKQEQKEPPEPVAPTASGSGSAAPKEDNSKQVARGEYLAGLSGCGGCHGGVAANGLPDPSKPFAGGLKMPEKFGTWIAPNITPDKTGIGQWKDDDIARAIREGTRPDGQQLYPIMPYLNYNRMTDDDVKAIVAYLRTLRPIENLPERTQKLALPKITPPKPANAPDPVSDPMKHGEYLATLMHCNACHTSMGQKGFDVMKPFAGGTEFELPMSGTGKLYSANITSDPETGIGKWKPEDVEKSIKLLLRPDGTVIQGPMQLYFAAGWNKLTDEDLKAIATWVKALPPIKNKVPKSTFKPTPPPAGGSNAGSGSAKPAGSAAGSGNANPGSGAAGSAAKPAGSAAGSGSGAKPAAATGNAAKPVGSGSAK